MKKSELLNNRFVSMLDDTTFKALWKSENGRIWFSKLIKLITTLDLNEYELYDPELNSGNKLKDYRMDILFIKKDNSKSIDIEMYSRSKKGDRIKPSQYAFNLLGTRLKGGEDYSEHSLVQVNFYNGYFQENKDINIICYQIRDESGNYDKKYLKIYDVYLSNYKGLCYNEADELEAMLSFLTGTSYDDLRRIANGNKEALDIVKDLEDLAMEEKFWGVYENNRENIIMQNTMYKEGVSDGVEQGINQGIKLNQIEIAKNMMKSNYSKDEISKITGLSLEEIDLI